MVPASNPWQSLTWKRFMCWSYPRTSCLSVQLGLSRLPQLWLAIRDPRKIQLYHLPSSRGLHEHFTRYRIFLQRLVRSCPVIFFPHISVLRKEWDTTEHAPVCPSSALSESLLRSSCLNNYSTAASLHRPSERWDSFISLRWRHFFLRGHTWYLHVVRVTETIIWRAIYRDLIFGCEHARLISTLRSFIKNVSVGKYYLFPRPTT